jgi:hypothetical protein
MDKKNIIIVVLIILLIALAGFSYYLYSGVMKCKATATDLGTKLQECGAGLNECMAGAQACQDMLTALRQIPECAASIPPIPTR